VQKQVKHAPLVEQHMYVSPFGTWKPQPGSEGLQSKSFVSLKFHVMTRSWRAFGKVGDGGRVKRVKAATTKALLCVPSPKTLCSRDRLQLHLLSKLRLESTYCHQQCPTGHEDCGKCEVIE